MAGAACATATTVLICREERWLALADDAPLLCQDVLESRDAASQAIHFGDQMLNQVDLDICAIRAYADLLRPLPAGARAP